MGESGVDLAGIEKRLADEAKPKRKRKIRAKRATAKDKGLPF